MERNYLTPAEISLVAIENGIKKVKTSRLNQSILAILAGVFIAFAAEGSNKSKYLWIGQSIIRSNIWHRTYASCCCWWRIIYR